MIDASAMATGLAIPLERAEQWVPYLNPAMEEREIDTPRRIAAFLAQCAIESAYFTRWVENLNYSTARGIVNAFGKRRFPDEDFASQYVRSPVALGNYAYANMNGNGDEASGDGWTFRGHGLIQLTGRANFRLAGDALGFDYVNDPDLLLQPEHAARASTWWWSVQRWRRSTLNDFADSDFIDGISGMVNRGSPEKEANHAAERRAAYERMLAVLLT